MISLPSFRISLLGCRAWAAPVSFPDAEPAENAVEDVVGDDRADDLAQLVHGEPQVESNQLVAGLFAMHLSRRPAVPPTPGSGCRGIGHPCRRASPLRLHGSEAFARSPSARPPRRHQSCARDDNAACWPELSGSGKARSALVQTDSIAARRSARRTAGRASAERHSSKRSAPGRTGRRADLGLGGDGVDRLVETGGIHQLDGQASQSQVSAM